MAVKIVTKFQPRRGNGKLPTAASLAETVSRSLRVPRLRQFELNPSTGQFTFELSHDIRARRLATWPDPERVFKLGQVFVGIEDGNPSFVLVAARHGVIRIAIDPSSKHILERLGELSGTAFRKRAKVISLKESDRQEDDDFQVTEFLARLPRPDLVQPDKGDGVKVPLNESSLVALGLLDQG